jgi:hypothetical protein
VEDPASQRRLAATGVVGEGPGEDLVEGGEALRPGDELHDRPRLGGVDARGDVDEHQLLHQLRPAGRERDRRQAAEGHPDHEAGVGGERLDRLGHRHGVGDGLVVVVLPPVGVAVAGEVDGDEGPVEGERHGVPRVGVLGAAVDEDGDGAGVPPDQRALRPTVGSGHGHPAQRRRAGPRQAGLAGVVGQEGELVEGGRHDPTVAKRTAGAGRHELTGVAPTRARMSSP